MAKQISAIKFVGTLGNLVGAKGIDGKTIIREKAASVANPQTEAQMNQRARLKLAAKVAGMLGEVGKLALKANGFKTTRRGTLNKDLLEKIYIVDNNTAAMPRLLSLVKNPMAVALPVTVTAGVKVQENAFTAMLKGLPVGTLSAKALLLFNRVTEQWTSVSALDTASEIVLAVADDPADYDAYFYAELVLPTTAEGSARLQQLLGKGPGYEVSVSRLDATNFGYSRTLNAGRVNGTAYNDTIIATPSAIINNDLTILGAGMESAINIGLAAAASAAGVSTLQQFININYGYVDPAASGLSNQVDWEKIQLSQGNLTGVALGEANFATPLTVTVPIDDSYSDPRFNSDDDKVFILVFSKTNNRSILSAGVTRISEQISVTVPSYWQGHYVEVFAFVQSATDAELCSDTIYCGNGRIA